MAQSSKTTNHPPSKKLKNERLSALSRAQEFPDEPFRASGPKLFCEACSHPITWARKDTVVDHIRAKKHVLNKDKLANMGRPKPGQQTLDELLPAKGLRDEFVQDLLITITGAGLSVEIADKLKPFLLKHCECGGAVPQPSTLRRTHLPRLFVRHEEQLKEHLKDEVIFVVFDETCDSADHFVLNIIFGEFLF
jgi:hypothetical protein